jgi:hypothetical protein
LGGIIDKDITSALPLHELKEHILAMGAKDIISKKDYHILASEDVNALTNLFSSVRPSIPQERFESFLTKDFIVKVVK